MEIELWDNGGTSFDRFTLIIDDDAWGLSIDQSPRGFCQYLGKVVDKFKPFSDIGVVREYLNEKNTKVDLIDVPQQVRDTILSILREEIFTEDELAERYRESIRDRKRSPLLCSLCRSHVTTPHA